MVESLLPRSQTTNGGASAALSSSRNLIFRTHTPPTLSTLFFDRNAHALCFLFSAHRLTKSAFQLVLANWGDDWGGCPEEPSPPSNKTTLPDARIFQCENFDRERFVSNFISFARPGTPKNGTKDALRLELGLQDNQVMMVATDHLRVRAVLGSASNADGDTDLITWTLLWATERVI